jgi:hypothetical protein
MILLEDAHHVLVAYPRHRHERSGDLGDLEDAVHQKPICAFGLHPELDLASVGHAITVANDKFLPSLGTCRWMEHTGIAWSICHINNVVATSAIERQKNVSLDKVFHSHNCWILLTVDNVAGRNGRHCSQQVVIDTKFTQKRDFGTAE